MLQYRSKSRLNFTSIEYSIHETLPLSMPINVFWSNRPRYILAFWTTGVVVLVSSVHSNYSAVDCSGLCVVLVSSVDSIIIVACVVLLNIVNINCSAVCKL